MKLYFLTTFTYYLFLILKVFHTTTRRRRTFLDRFKHSKNLRNSTFQKIFLPKKPSKKLKPSKNETYFLTTFTYYLFLILKVFQTTTRRRTFLDTGRFKHSKNLRNSTFQKIFLPKKPSKKLKPSKNETLFFATISF